MTPDFFNDPQCARFLAWLKADVDDSQVDYRALLALLDEKINMAEKMGPFSVLKRDEIASDAMWESLEFSLNNRIHDYTEYDQPIDACIAGENSLPPQAWDALREKLNARINELEKLPQWEQRLKGEKIIPAGAFERIEKGINERISRLEQRPKKNIVFLMFPFATPLRAAAVIALCALGGATGFLAFQKGAQPLPTYVFFGQGADAAMVKKASPMQRQYSSTAGGAIRIANTHGYVVLENGAGLSISRVSKREARYTLRVPGKTATAASDFYVTHHRAGETFSIATGDYTIKVLGTYFRCSTDKNGRVTTQVFEGRVRALLPDGERTIIAGQSLRYEENGGFYRVSGGGPIISKQNADPMPDLTAMPDYGILDVSTSVESAQVFIDGGYKGTAPLSVLLPVGRHRMRVDKPGYTAFDTAFDLRLGSSLALNVPIGKALAIFVVPAVPQIKLKPVNTSGTEKQSVTAAPSADPDSSQNLSLSEAQQLERSDYNAAIEGYRILFDNKNASALVRQTALFSIGNLLADQARDREAAKGSFLTYLTLFPKGNFACEALLRLAELELSTDPDKAIEYYQTYFNAYPTHYRVGELEYRVGLLNLQKKRYDKGIALLKQALDNLGSTQLDLKEKAITSLYRAQAEADSAQKTRASR
jgi:hypothetical protein